MNKLFGIFLLSTTLSCMAQSDEIKILHYNIKELDSTKINHGVKDEQLQAVQNILNTHQFDIVSFNEVQYDLPNVPDNAHKSKGENLQKLKVLFGLDSFLYESFNIANTGLKAKTKTDGTYYVIPNTAEARAHADQINFGTLPGQYSSGALFKYKKVKEVVINDLKWKDFNPNVDLSAYKTATGASLPSDMELFDKNLTDITMEVNGKELHLILLHTVPAFHFGNKHSVNYLRNAEQLKFLEWYLTGSTDFDVKLSGIKPLAKDSYYVATGDWNTELSNISNPGSKVLKNLFKKSKLWIDEKELTFTNEGGGFEEKPMRLMLDYIVYSKNIDILDAKILHPNFQRIDLGCNGQIPTMQPVGFILETYKRNGKQCNVFIHHSYKRYKQASDHYPIWGHFKLK